MVGHEFRIFNVKTEPKRKCVSKFFREKLQLDAVRRGLGAGPCSCPVRTGLLGENPVLLSGSSRSYLDWAMENVMRETDGGGLTRSGDLPGRGRKLESP
jgi:hypothetical protein